MPDSRHMIIITQRRVLLAAVPTSEKDFGAKTMTQLLAKWGIIISYEGA